MTISSFSGVCRPVQLRNGASYGTCLSGKSTVENRASPLLVQLDEDGSGLRHTEFRISPLVQASTTSMSLNFQM